MLPKWQKCYPRLLIFSVYLWIVSDQKSCETLKKGGLQSFAKYIWNLLGFTENLDLKWKFNVGFGLFWTRKLLNLIFSEKTGNCLRHLLCSFSLYIPIMFRLWLQLFLNLRNFSNAFCKWFSQKFSSWNFGFFKP